MENNIDINKFWERIGIATFSFLIGLGFTASLFIYWSNNQEAAPEKTAEEIAAEVILNNPELFLNREFADSVLKSAGYHKVTATVYNPVARQCDKDPLITADCSRIDLDKLDTGEIKWIAVSRDLLQHFNYGDVIELKSISDPSINGTYEIHDTMNKRFKNYIDILSPKGKSLGKWDDVVIRKVEI